MSTKVDGDDLGRPGPDLSECCVPYRAGGASFEVGFVPSSHRCDSTLRSMEEARHHVDDEGQDHSSEQVGEEGVRESNPPYALGREIRVRYLERHTNGQRYVGEVQIGGRIFFVEIDPTHWGR